MAEILKFTAAILKLAAIVLKFKAEIPKLAARISNPVICDLKSCELSFKFRGRSFVATLRVKI